MRLTFRLKKSSSESPFTGQPRIYILDCLQVKYLHGNVIFTIENATLNNLFVFDEFEIITMIAIITIIIII